VNISDILINWLDACYRGVCSASPPCSTLSHISDILIIMHSRESGTPKGTHNSGATNAPQEQLLAGYSAATKALPCHWRMWLYHTEVGRTLVLSPDTYKAKHSSRVLEPAPPHTHPLRPHHTVWSISNGPSGLPQSSSLQHIYKTRASSDDISCCLWFPRSTSVKCMCQSVSPCIRYDCLSAHRPYSLLFIVLLQSV
jgi:hypothetical protein